MTAASTESGTRMNINQAHSLLRHGNDTSTRLSAKELGWEITHGKMKPCEHCACSKAKQKNVSKEETTEKSKKPCKQAYLDLFKITVPHSNGTESTINKKNWRRMVDEATGKKWSSFHDSKSGMVEPTCDSFLMCSKAKDYLSGRFAWIQLERM